MSKRHYPIWFVASATSILITRDKLSCVCWCLSCFLRACLTGCFGCGLDWPYLLRSEGGAMYQLVCSSHPNSKWLLVPDKVSLHGLEEGQEKWNIIFNFTAHPVFMPFHFLPSPRPYIPSFSPQLSLPLSLGICSYCYDGNWKQWLLSPCWTD